MAGGAYYNEIDPFAAQTTRELIADGVIAPGVVDERDIRDILPSELAGFTQCHFFAGGGVWSYALRRAGWPDDAPIWTGSCPCQPFSAAGKGLGFDDERHLWPAWQWLIDQCGPELVAGEQVADKGADAWLDLVQADLEGMGYAFGCVPLASAGFGAPNPRHRSYWLAHADRDGCGEARSGGVSRGHVGTVGNGTIGWLANSSGLGPSRIGRGRQDRTAEHRDADRLANPGRGVDERRSERGEPLCPAGPTEGQAREWQRRGFDAGHSLPISGLADAMRAGRTERRTWAGSGPIAGSRGDSDCDPGPVNGFWRDADWLLCRDPRGPRWRPVDAGTFPLAPRTAGGVGALRVSGNAINAEVATGFIEAVIDHLRAPVSAAA